MANAATLDGGGPAFEEPVQNPVPPRVITVNGENFLWVEGYGDLPGYWEPLGTASNTASTAMTDYQAGNLGVDQGSLALQQARFEFEKQQWLAQQAQQSGGMTPAQQADLELARQRLALEERQFEADQAYRQQQMELERNQNLAQLRANPASWLQYSLEAGETPAVQPWMLPLSPDEYGLRVGQPLPNWVGLPQNNRTPAGGTGSGQPVGGGGLGTPAGGSGTNAGTFSGGGQAGAYGTVPGQGQVVAGAPGLLPGLGGTMPGLSVAQSNELAGLNRLVASGATGSAAPLTPQQQQLLQQYMPGTWQMWLAQGGQSGLPGGAGGFFNPIPPQTQQPVAPVPGTAPTGSTQPTVPTPVTPTSPTTSPLPGATQGPMPVPAPLPPPDASPPGTMGGLTPEDIQRLMGFANGGIAWGPTNAILGENGPEAVIPLQQGSYLAGTQPPTVPGSINLGSPPTTTGSWGSLGSDVHTLGVPSTPTATSTGTSTYPPLTPGTMPWLMNPSRQYQARLGPDQLAQYYAYEQFRTGATPEQQAWRLFSMGPPAGANRGFQYRR